MSFASKLKVLRLEKGYSLQALADKIGVSKAHVWDLERGQAKNPSLEVLEKLSTALGKPVAFLIGEDPESEGQESESVVMYRDLQKLEPEDRETIKIMMERLKKRTEN